MNYSKNCPKSLIDSLSKSKRGDNVFIVGGGPSVLQYLPDYSILFNQDVIAVNNSYRIFPNAILCHFADKIWYGWHTDPKFGYNIHENFHNPVTTADYNNNSVHWKPYKHIAAVFKRAGANGSNVKIGLAKENYEVGGNNGGQHAINIAYHIGYKNVILLGFDLRQDLHSTHWHNEHHRPVNKLNYSHTIIPSFEQLGKDVDEIDDFNVINTNYESALKCFPYGKLEDYLI